MEEINNDIQDIEKPKKQKMPISEAQRKHLQDMRDKRKAMSILNKEKKNIEKYSNLHREKENIPRENKDNIELIKLSNEMAEIKKHLEDIKKMKEEKRKLKDAVDIKTSQEKKDNYDEMLYKQLLMKNFLK